MLIANIFSALGTLLLAISTFSSKKGKMLCIQVADCGFTALANLFIRSYSGMIANLILIRNVLNAKEKMNKYIFILLCVLLVVLGSVSNTKDVIGLLPLVASLEYSVCTICKGCLTAEFSFLVYT